MNKSTSSNKKPSIVVRQTLTSKLRAERGDKLSFLTSELEKLKAKRDLQLTGGSKESLDSSKFKLPQNIAGRSIPNQTNIKSTNGSNMPAPKNKNIQVKSDKCINNNKKMETTVLNRQSLARNVSKSAVPPSNKNRSLVAPNSARTTLSSKFNQGKCSLLPNQMKFISKIDEKPRRQTLMPPKKVPAKSALKNSGISTNGVKKSVTVKSPLRKSLTAMHFKRVSNCNKNNAIHRTVSWSDGISPVRESPFAEKMSFRTPSMAQRRSIVLATPMSGGKASISPYPVYSTPSTKDLKKRLSLWLERKGKPLDSFHHLQCFGLGEAEEEDKENIEPFVPDLNGSYESLKIEHKIISVANDALYDLHKLILEDYSLNQCEAWLDIIASRFPEIQENAQYWECRAALEESRGNYKSAIDCYGKAITKGAEVQKVNSTLDNLLEKFSVLNISQTDAKTNQQCTKAVLDARNVFKSSVINFAIKERNKKLNVEESCQFVATPVRRSTRISRSGYVTTPNTKICSTLNELDSSVRNSLHFQANRGFKH